MVGPTVRRRANQGRGVAPPRPPHKECTINRAPTSGRPAAAPFPPPATRNAAAHHSQVPGLGRQVSGSGSQDLVQVRDIPHPYLNPNTRTWLPIAETRDLKIFPPPGAATRNESSASQLFTLPACPLAAISRAHLWTFARGSAAVAPLHVNFVSPHVSNALHSGQLVH